MNQEIYHDTVEGVHMVNHPPTFHPQSLLNPDMQADGSNPMNITMGAQQIGAVFQPDTKPLDNFALIEDMRRQINEATFADTFRSLNALTPGQQTAYEISERLKENLRLMGPVAGRYNRGNTITLQNLLRFMIRFDMMPPPPVEMEGMDINGLKFSFTSIFSKAERQSETAALNDHLMFTERMVGIYGPEAADKNNPVEMMNNHARMNGIAQKNLNGDDVVREKAEQRQAAEEAQQQLAMKQMEIEAMKVASEVKLNEAKAQAEGLDETLSNPGTAGNAGEGVPV